MEKMANAITRKWRVPNGENEEYFIAWQTSPEGLRRKARGKARGRARDELEKS